VFGVAVATTSLTHLSRDAAARDWDGLRATLRRGLRMVLFLTVPSTIGLALLGVPIIRLIYQHGRFSEHATVATAQALSGYALGLVSYAAIKVAAPAFYALGRTRVPLIASVSAVAANLLWNLTTFHTFGHVGLAVGTSLAATVNLAVLVVAFQIQIGGLFTRDFFGAVARIALAAAVMAAVVWVTSMRLEPLEIPPRVLGWAIKVFVPVTLGAVVYFGVARVLRLDEATALVRRR
jgi:putative peptidoglycan lipid II flippase